MKNESSQIATYYLGRKITGKRVKKGDTIETFSEDKAPANGFVLTITGQAAGLFTEARTLHYAYDRARDVIADQIAEQRKNWTGDVFDLGRAIFEEGQEISKGLGQEAREPKAEDAIKVAQEILRGC